MSPELTKLSSARAEAVAKKIWLFIDPKKIGTHVTVRPSARPPVHSLGIVRTIK